MSISFHVNMAVTLAPGPQATANFGTAVVVDEHSVTANRLDGPYASLAAAESAGFTAAAAPGIHGWLTALFSQNPRTSQAYVGRRAASESIPATMAAIEAVNPAAAYCTCLVSNETNDLIALATWTETRSKIAVVQSSSSDMLAGTASAQQVSTITVGGTATDGVYSIEVINAWTGASIGTASHTRSGAETNDDVATALRAAYDAVAELAGITAPAAGTGADVELTFDGLGNGYEFVLTAPAPGTLTEATPAFVQNPGELLAALNFDRTALIYHDDDTEYLDAAWVSRCLAFNLDAPGGAGVWAYHELKGITATSLTDAQKTELLSNNVNYYSPVTYTSGVEEPGFTWEGKMVSGRYIDFTTTIDVTVARMEEALLATFKAAAASSRPKIAADDKGISRLQGAAEDVFARLVRASHYQSGAVSSASGRVTPYVDAPRAADRSDADKAARRLTLTAEAVAASAIQSVGDAANVGFTIDVTL